jgi:hypothetical protein
VAKAPLSVTLVLPDYAEDMPVTFAYVGGQVQVTIPQLISYLAVVAQ